MFAVFLDTVVVNALAVSAVTAKYFAANAVSVQYLLVLVCR